jgi:hypothetical protein
MPNKGGIKAGLMFWGYGEDKTNTCIGKAKVYIRHT